MFLLAYETEADAYAAAEELRGFGARARRLLEECVEHQSVTRTKISQAAQLLDRAGFVFIHDHGDMWESKCTIQPSLAGEEALEALELLEVSIGKIKANSTD